jgi:hypothetical protein
VHEDLKRMVPKEAQDDIECEEQVEDQVSNFFFYCLNLLSDLDSVRNLKHMLTKCMGE